MNKKKKNNHVKIGKPEFVDKKDATEEVKANIEKLNSAFCYSKGELKEGKEKFEREDVRNKIWGIIFYGLLSLTVFLIAWFSLFFESGMNHVSDTIVITLLFLAVYEPFCWFILYPCEVTFALRLGVPLAPFMKPGFQRYLFGLDRIISNPLEQVLGEKFRNKKITASSALLRLPLVEASYDFTDNISARIKGSVYYRFLQDDKNPTILRISLNRFFLKIQDVAKTLNDSTSHHFRLLVESKAMSVVKKTTGTDLVNDNNWLSFVRDILRIGFAYVTLAITDIILDPEDIKVRRIAFEELQKQMGREHKYTRIITMLKRMEKEAEGSKAVKSEDLKKILMELETLERLKDVDAFNIFGSDGKQAIASMLNVYGNNK
ncbi:MAG: hypothetical protein KAS07_01990 [Candidatus Pacebacteria bacterium]|nr:hypothetical protein [Candidatus Paceibacterota bacterium]